MTTYKVWVTVKDRYGNTKEVDGGNISIQTNLDILSEEALDIIEKSLPLDDYIKRENLDAELDAYATDDEVVEAIENHVDPHIEQKVEQQVEQKVEHVVEQKVDQKVEQAVVPKVEQVVEQKVDQAVEQKVEQTVEQTLETVVLFGGRA